MTEDEIQECNILIANFMGYKKDKDDYYFLLPANLLQFNGSNHGEWATIRDVNIDTDFEEFVATGGYYWSLGPYSLWYNRSWDWLMPVIRKIFNFNDINEYKESSGWYAYYGLETSITVVEIEWSFLNCVNFIKWYNETQNGSF